MRWQHFVFFVQPFVSFVVKCFNHWCHQRNHKVHKDLHKGHKDKMPATLHFELNALPFFRHETFRGRNDFEGFS